MKFAGSAIFALLCIASISRGANLSLPLNGYFHPGRAMPVQWDSSGEATIDHAAKGAVSVHVNCAGVSHGVFPFLVLDQNVQDDSLPLHTLDNSQTLVAEIADDPHITDLFSGSVIVEHLNVQHPLEGPAMAWETLDALVLPPESWANIFPETIRQLFAEGVMLAVRGDSAPNDLVPWQRRGQWWIASCNVALPQPVNPGAFAPTYGWTAGRSADFRAHIVLLAAVFVLAACGAVLWKSRWMPAAIVFLCAIASLAFAWDNHGVSSIAQAVGAVHFSDSRADFQDTWLYSISHRDTDFAWSVAGSVHPIFFEADRIADAHLVIDCDSLGNPVQLEGRLKADDPLAVMSRRVAPAVRADNSRVTSPMLALRNSGAYQELFLLFGQLNDASDSPLRWATIVIAPAE